MFINSIRYFLPIAICSAITYILLKVIFNICTNLFVTDIFLCTNFIFFYFRKRLKNFFPISKHFTYLLIYLNYHKAIAMSSKISYSTPPLRFVVQISPFLEDFLNIFVFLRHIRHLFKNLYNQFSLLATFQVIFQ